MGQEGSREQVDPDTPPQTISSRTLDGIVEYIRDGRAKKVVVMTGAGISTSAGIPDFRSPETGLYANLARLELPYPEAVFDISYFREKPEPFYVLAKELYPGNFYPTISHSFVALLEQKSMLQMLFTQNIDCLERRAGVPRRKIVEAHGSFATQRCIECKTEYPDEPMKEKVMAGEVPHCMVPQCNGLVKPDIVFFGEPLPDRFHQNKHMPGNADLVIVMGTSLSVQPFASLPQLTREGIPRLLLNNDLVGDLGCRPDDVVVLGDCDSGVRRLADALGWLDELEAMWREVSGKPQEINATEVKAQRGAMSKDELLEAEIEKLTSEVDTSLQVSKDHEERVQRQLDKSQGEQSTIKPLPQDPVVPLKAKTSDEKPDVTSLVASEVDETSPVNVEKLTEEKPAQAPSVDSKAILDVTLPQNRPEQAPSGSKI